MRIPIKQVLLLSLAAVGAVVVAACLGPVGAALRTGAGSAAHNLYSSLFISGLPERQTREELVRGLFGRSERLLRVKVDAAAQTVDAWLLLAHARAVYTPGYGCRPALGPDRAATWASASTSFLRRNW
jgi:hypothetical protein